MTKQSRAAAFGGGALVLALTMALVPERSEATTDATPAPASPSARNVDPSSQGEVARAGALVVTRAELDQAIDSELRRMKAEHAQSVSELERAAARELLDQKLLHQKAEQQGVSSDELLKREVAGRIAPPSEAELRTLYDALLDQGEDVGSFASERDALVVTWMGDRVERGVDLYLRELRKEQQAKILLAPVLPPKEPVLADGPAVGPSAAKLTIVAFVDLECPFCADGDQTLARLRESHPNELRVVHQDLPLEFHEHAARAAEAVHCAADQGKHAELKSRLYAHQGDLGEAALARHARAVGIDAERFDACMSTGEKAAVVEASLARAEQLGVTSTPTYFVNGRRLEGAQPFERFEELISAELEH